MLWYFLVGVFNLFFLGCIVFVIVSGYFWFKLGIDLSKTTIPDRFAILPRWVSRFGVMSIGGAVGTLLIAALLHLIGLLE
jgi:hypothetical protein